MTLPDAQPRIVARRLSAIAGAVATVVVVCPNAQAVVLDVDLVPQQGALWCWAASTEMILDYLSPSPQCVQEVGKCSLALRVPAISTAQCECDGVDIYRSSIACDKASPIGEGDFVPGLLRQPSTIVSQAGAHHALSRDLLACELNRERPVAFSWLQSPSCSGSSHMAVAAGVVGEGEETLVLVLDPSPERTGDRAWLTWRGYVCGEANRGQCASYYGIGVGVGGPGDCFWPVLRGDPAPCSSASLRDPLTCSDHFEGEFTEVSDVETFAETILSDAAIGAEVLTGLGLTSEFTSISCDDSVVLIGQETVVLTEGLAKAIGKTRTTRERYLCSVSDAEGGESHPMSLLVYRSKGDGKLALAGFGEANSTLASLEVVEKFRLSMAILGFEPADGRLRIDEVIVPGTGQTIFVDPRFDGLALRSWGPGTAIDEKLERFETIIDQPLWNYKKSPLIRDLLQDRLTDGLN